MNHLFISLPDPSNEFINRLNDMFYKFIWNNKIDKVKQTAITRDYLKGGLKMINIGQFIKALKCTWISQFYKQQFMDISFSNNIWTKRSNLFL